MVTCQETSTPPPPVVAGTPTSSTKNIPLDYGIGQWGEGYFSINEAGHVIVRPYQDHRECDLHTLVQDLVKRGLNAPMLIRFDGIITHRIRAIKGAFEFAMKEFKYNGGYQLAFPIKVNQQAHVVDTICNEPIGLEIGSKPELTAILSRSNRENNLLLCNGYKDAEYIELALLARKLGHRCIIIIEQLNEVDLILEISKKLNVDIEVGLRMKPINKGSGRWSTSGGEQAKFGLTSYEILRSVEKLTAAGKEHCITLLHFHIGSQITTIFSIKKVLQEATRVYTELAKICPSLQFFDVGGGLGVDYQGSRSCADSSLDYTIGEYARDVVYAIGNACDKAHIPHPNIITESGRAVVAHHSILITEVIDVERAIEKTDSATPPPTKNELLEDLYQLHQNISVNNCREALHDTYQMQEMLFDLFIQRSLSLQEKGYGEWMIKLIMAKIHEMCSLMESIPEDLSQLNHSLIDNYFCNFSIFQSVPDSWAIQQIFPIMPIQQLDKAPTQRAVLADLSCDSDGIIKHFAHGKQTSSHIMLHADLSQTYYLGVFLVGAYQETLGDLHNLFGDTNALHVNIDEDDHWYVSRVVEGDSIKEVLAYVQYNTESLIASFNTSLENAVKQGRINFSEVALLRKRYREALESYTYLTV